jgi:UDP-N-acetylglucosamine 2-epimerase (non-hydrolysing)
VVFPLHPRTRTRIAEIGIDPGKLHLCEPQPYIEFLALQSRATAVLTDSGGIQEETTYLGVPCLTLRENTERPITISQGTNRLGGTSVAGIRSAIRDALAATSGAGIPELWDGRAAPRIVEILARQFGN